MENDDTKNGLNTDSLDEQEDFKVLLYLFI